MSLDYNQQLENEKYTSLFQSARKPTKKQKYELN